jgi:CheY-like chemotaxis protein
MPDTLPRRRLLVADDDPSTRHFLGSALAALGYEVALADDGLQALAMARVTAFDALLLDCRMPRAGALDVLQALRADPAAASHGAVAMATSAEVDAGLRQSLIEAGFACVVEKPCRVASLGHALGATLGVGGLANVLDDTEALRATGDSVTMRALRGLLRDELVQLREEMQGLGDDAPAFLDRLHRLRSACGFCGAARLAAQATALQHHLQEVQVASPAATERFHREVEATIQALAEHSPGL